MTPEFSRLVPVDRIPDLGSRENLEANADERAALARRFDLVSIAAFSGRLELLPWRKGGVKVSGTLKARVTYSCVLSLEPFDQELDVPVERYFLAQTNAGATALANLESLDADDEPDLISGTSIDLGELAAESLGLALDPYPRKPGVEFASGPEPGEAAPEAASGRPNPFAGLAKLKEKGD